MPAPAIKAIIISISLVTALGIAIYENPEVQRWLEEQRRRLVELLRGIGPDLDPQTRREAEAFAFEGRTANNDEAIRRELEASRGAAAVATGRSTSSPSAVRRIPIRGPEDETVAEDRRRQGREYLARRNQQMYELQQRRRTEAEQDGVSPPTTPTSFDAMVDHDGKLKTPEMELPSPPTFEPVSKKARTEMTEAPRSLEQPTPAGESSSSLWANSGWQIGSRLANPFGDEFEMERSQTPKPPVPPKIELPKQPEISAAPVEAAPEHQTAHEELSYEEQLAIALSLSEAESSKPSATVRQSEPEDQDADLRAAIEASLRDMDGQQDAHAIANAAPETPRLLAQPQPLVDLTPDPPTSTLRDFPRGHWNDLFDQPNWAEEREVADPPVSIPPRAVADEDDELYRVTPQLTRARLATLQATHTGPQNNLPYDPVHEAASAQPQQPMEASFYSAHSRSASPPTSHTLSSAQTPQLVDISEEPAAGARTPTLSPSHASTFTFSSDSESATFASLSALRPRDQSVARSEISQPQAPSAAHSEISEIEVIDVAEDSDIDMLSEEGDGVRTPDSWSEIESRDGESEVDTTERRRAVELA